MRSRRLPQKLQSQLHLTSHIAGAIRPERNSALTDVRERHGNIADGTIAHVDGRVDSMTVISAAFAQDQSMSGTQAPGRTVWRNRLIEHKIGAQFKGAFYTRYPIRDCEYNRLRIRLAPPQLLDHLAAGLDVVAVHKNCVEFTARDGLTGRIRGGNCFHINSYRLEDPADDA